MNNLSYVHRNNTQSQGIGQMFGALKNKYRSWYKYRETVGELSRLSNEQLSDLGIGRVDIEQIARNTTR